MKKLSIEDLWSLEEYSKRRPAFRAEAIDRKRARTVCVGPNVTFLFEDNLTIRYQVQEMLRIEKTFERDGIQAELDAYNPLIPDGKNLKATMLIEYPDEAERKQALSRLVGIEHQVWLEARNEKANAIADEDIPRSNNAKTSAVHFLRFELSPSMTEKVKLGEQLTLKVAHPNYTAQTLLSRGQSAELGRDLD